MNIFEVGDRFAKPLKMELPPGLVSLKAKDCGDCHAEIYTEWKESMHAKAWTDPYYQVDLRFDGNQQICLNCHIPLENQQENLVLGFRDAERFDPILAPNPNFDLELQQEGVTCAVCHVKEGQIIGPQGNTLAPHPTTRDPEMAKGMTACAQCHVVANHRWDVFYKIPPCGTVAEIKAGGQEEDCVGCHLPKVERPLVEGYPSRPSGRHLFRGGHHPPTVAQALAVQVRQRKGTQGLEVEVTLENQGAAHALPTGTPDRHLTLRLRLLGPQGQIGPEESFVLKRSVLWRPFIIDWKDTRLLRGQPKNFVFKVDQSDLAPYDQLEVLVTYHLLDKARRQRIGYQNQEPIFYPIYQKIFPLTP
ncbi:MAG: hypothetical protein A2557_01440 [Candidatus Lambdaproteobacteria bacterium RIFOXYD2_FULL_56_26]|uniref:Cytochrome c-552/4 domain-containing protein n=1 Tax=Candidatus Lambdaproteobacteria bacterium RIFOXYD2_FULL_56_26 TaxID=1817773 RepID=A0A1F6GPG2_9PROT|nr:MAG: hypothetical protein A2557_01440 [Candidatus Lambdaproteobacteria bacterium RIFOXYD2_FULL_56_26]